MGTAKAGYYVVTPSLIIGKPSRVPLSNTVEAFSSHDAFNIMNKGKIAIVPTGRWDMAANTLRLLGLEEDVVQDRLHFAKTGQTLVEE